MFNEHKAKSKKAPCNFSREERLRSKKLIKKLFATGSSFHQAPLKVYFLFYHQEAGTPHQVIFSVPKRIFKKAVDRNKLKRRMREAYRLHKQLLPATESTYLLAFVYISREKLPFNIIEDKLKALLMRLERKPHR